MKKKETADNEKEVLIEVINTPKGAVPTADSIKNLVALWNDILQTMNRNLEKIARMFSDISKMLDDMRILLKSIDSKIENISSRFAETKVFLKNIDHALKSLEISSVSDESGEKREEAKKVLREIFKSNREK